MKLLDLKTILGAHPDKTPRLILPDGDQIPPHFHVTEVGYVTKKFIDCGGLTAEAETCLLQTWIGEDVDHHLTNKRFAEILQLGESVLPHDHLEVEIEYDCCVVAQYPIVQVKPAGRHLDLMLGRKQTQCLARERRKLEAASACCGASACC